jgi:hypothetical protein
MVVPFAGLSSMAIASEPISSRQPLWDGLAEDAVKGFIEHSKLAKKKNN